MLDTYHFLRVKKSVIYTFPAPAAAQLVRKRMYRIFLTLLFFSLAQDGHTGGDKKNGSDYSLSSVLWQRAPFTGCQSVVQPYQPFSRHSINNLSTYLTTFTLRNDQQRSATTRDKESEPVSERDYHRFNKLYYSLNSVPDLVPEKRNAPGTQEQSQTLKQDNNPYDAIVHTPRNKQNKLSMASAQDQRSNHKKKGRPNRKKTKQSQRRNTSDKGNQQNNPPPPPPKATKLSDQQQSEPVNYFAIIIQDQEFRIPKKQLAPMRRGQESANHILAYSSDNPANKQPLSLLEGGLEIPREKQLANYNQRVIDYLFTYGTSETQKSLKRFYPVHLLSAEETHLRVSLFSQKYPDDEPCAICEEPFITRHTLTSCHACHKMLHTTCLGRWFAGKIRSETCPNCRAKQPAGLQYILTSKDEQLSILHRGAHEGNIPEVVAMLEVGTDVNGKNEDGDTAMHLASRGGHSNIVSLLIEYGADFKATNKAKQSPIDVAFASRNAGVFEILKQARDKPPLFSFVAHGQVEALRNWLDDGGEIDANTRIIDGSTLLHFAIEHEQLEAVRILLDYASKKSIPLADQRNQVNVTALMQACITGNAEVAKLLLEYGAATDLKTQGSCHMGSGQMSSYQTSEFSALTMACQYGHTGIVKLLLEYGASVNQQNSLDFSALMLAAINDHSKIVELLLEYGTHINQQDYHSDSSALMMASRNGSTETVRLLLEYNASVDLQNKYGWSALMMASLNNHADVVRLLLEHQASVDIQEHWGYSILENHAGVQLPIHEISAVQPKNKGGSALMLAAQAGNIEIIKLLLEYKASVNLQSQQFVSALMLAASNDHSKIVELLLEYGADVNLQSHQGLSALMTAASKSHVETVRILLKYGADTDLQDYLHGRSALMMASQNGHVEIARLLLAHNTSVDLQTLSGMSALMVASYNGHTELAKLLLKHNASTGLQEQQGHTALMMASLSGHIELIWLFLAHKASIDLQNRHGISALMLAHCNGHTQVVGLLLMYKLIQTMPQMK